MRCDNSTNGDEIVNYIMLVVVSGQALLDVQCPLTWH